MRPRCSSSFPAGNLTPSGPAWSLKRLISQHGINLQMQPNELRKRLRGVISFPCTPFKKDLSLDLDGLRKNLRSLLEAPDLRNRRARRHGRNPLTLAGGTSGRRENGHRRGEGQSAGADRNRLQSADCRRTCPKQAAAAGVSGILAFPPYYPARKTRESSPITKASRKRLRWA